MGLRNFLCLLPAETPDHHNHHDGWAEEMEQPGTSYNKNNNNNNNNNEEEEEEAPNNYAYREYYNRKMKSESRENKVNCSSGSAQLLACFRAGAINLIVHPACELACQRQGASTVQPVNSLPRPTFLDGAEEHGDDPTSPVVSCIGQVRKEKASKTPPRTTEAAQNLRSLRGKPQNREDESTGASRPCKWSQILGARGGTVNPSQQQTREATTTESTAEFHIDLNRFGCSSNSAQATPTFGNQMKFGRPDYTTGTSTSATQCGDEPARDSKGASEHEPVVALKSPPQAAAEGVLLWKRRSAKPMSLDLKKREAPARTPNPKTSGDTIQSSKP